VRLKAHLAARKMLVRQTIGIAVEKHTPQNQKNQVKNSLVTIVLSPGENGGAQLEGRESPRTNDKNQAPSDRKENATT